MSRFFIVLLAISFSFLCSSSSAIQIDYDANAVIIDGQRRIILSGAIHYPRSTPQMWPDLIQKAKNGGLDAIETYIFWNVHEPRRREYDFTGNLDFVKFFQLIQQAGLYGIIRIGPYACAEWTYGGFPVWLHNIPGIEFRTNNEIYKNEMQIFTTKIVNLCKEAKLFASQGGPIILAQIENEYGNIMGPYGGAGVAYMNWCAEMAIAQNIGVPWIMCQQDNAPRSVINTCNGYYCDSFNPNNPKSPKMWTENWIGWFKKWGERDPHRTAEDTAFAVARFFQRGGVLQNYYMYHGGTNFGLTAGGPLITTSYDYDAPLDEYGNLNQPKWGHLKQLHAALKLGEKIITNGVQTTKNLGNGVDLTTYTNNATGERFCYLSNIDGSKDANIDLQQEGKYFVPAWSVSILEGCNKEIYNTAKVNVQTSIMVKKPLTATASWSWTPEIMKDTLHGKGNFTASKLLDQKQASSESSDYLWYTTSFNINAKTKNAILYVNSSGEVLHAYVNKKLIGDQMGNTFQFQKPISLKHPKNTITLLSVTVGLQNYGSFFDVQPNGISGGPVKLIDAKTNATLLDLSSNLWTYKIGLNGEAKRLFDPNSKKAKGHAWFTTKQVPKGRPMTWYKTSFKVPQDTDPVVVDLQGMGKGHAWVNGNSLGRFWLTQIADLNGCSATCDYRGGYSANKCVSNCGNPSQRWYHVPRSFLNNGDNTLVLFEEFGGDPSNVSFQTITVGTVCGNAYEGSTLELSCQGGSKIMGIEFASFGDHHELCGSFSKGSSEAINTLSIVQKVCVGKGICSIEVSDKTFGGNNATSSDRRLAVQAVCS